MDIIAHLLFYGVAIKDKPRKGNSVRHFFYRHLVDFIYFTEQHGVSRAISYILQTLSAEPAFGAKMSSPIRAQLPTKWGPVDIAADFIIHVSFQDQLNILALSYSSIGGICYGRYNIWVILLLISSTGYCFVQCCSLLQEY